METLIPKVAMVARENNREASTESLIAQSVAFGALYDTASAEVGRQAAHRMGLPETVQGGLYEVAEAWNGEGAPRNLKGEDISLASRVARIAGDAAFFSHVGGVNLAIEAVQARAGTLHDPSFAGSCSTQPRSSRAWKNPSVICSTQSPNRLSNSAPLG
ncbi:MAG: hypothetical protein ABR505_06145 [Actinomycetota bacterium]